MVIILTSLGTIQCSFSKWAKVQSNTVPTINGSLRKWLLAFYCVAFLRLVVKNPRLVLVINLCVSRINATQGRASLCEPALSNAPVQPRNCSNVTRSFPVREFGGWERDLSLWRKIYPAKMLSYTVIRACMVNYTIDYRDYVYGIADWKRINFARHSPEYLPTIR